MAESAAPSVQQPGCRSIRHQGGADREHRRRRDEEQRDGDAAHEDSLDPARRRAHPLGPWQMVVEPRIRHHRGKLRSQRGDIDPPLGVRTQVDQSRHRQFVERHRGSEPRFEEPRGFRRFEQMHRLDPGGLPEQGQDRLEPGVRGLCRNLQGQGRGQHLLGGAQRVVKRDQPDPAEGGEIDHQRDNPGHEARGFVRPQGKLAPSAGSRRSDHWTAAASGSTSIP